MRIFFDTEFTGLHKNTTLISLGCVDEEGRTFYAEFTDYEKQQVDCWINENVIKNLIQGDYEEIKNTNCGDDWYVRGNKAMVREALDEWLSQYSFVEFYRTMGV